MTQKMGRGDVIIGLYDEDGSDQVKPTSGDWYQLTGIIKYQFMMKIGLIKCSRRQVIGRRGN